MKNKPYKTLLEDYKNMYGDIPMLKEDIIPYLENKLNLKERDYERIKSEEDYVASIPWEELEIILPIIPKPSPRPRYSRVSKQFYVTGAAENKKLLKYYIEDVYHIIYTQTYFELISYLPTPMSSMTKSEIIRAEKGSISAMSNPDWDNLGKTYSDMIQQILLLNDNIITKGNSEKYYSVKPRVVIRLKYQKGFDSKFNKKRVINSTNYKKAIEVGNIIEVYSEGNELW